jgi:putative endonuclease
MTDSLARYQKGHWAESVAALYLSLKFYRLLNKRYKTPHGEIDLVMKRGRSIVFVEVKARATMTVGVEAISDCSRLRIQSAAQHFIQRHPRYRDYVWRFDALVVSPKRMPYHIKDAWRP